MTPPIQEFRKRFASKFDWPVVSVILLMIFLSSSSAYYSIVGSVDRFSKELNLKEEAFLDHLVRGLAAIGISSIKSENLRQSNIFELTVWNQMGRAKESYTFTSGGRFVAGKRGAIDGYLFEVKFTRPESPIFGIATGSLEFLSQMIAQVSFLLFLGTLFFTDRNDS